MVTDGVPIPGLRVVHMFERFPDILASDPIIPGDGIEIGRSREGRALRAVRFGAGPRRVSLVGGSHADEPVGPWLLRRLASYLTDLPADDPMLDRYAWWILPHINPDGEVRNASWADETAETFDAGSYLGSVVRELPGDDIEFGYPRAAGDEGVRPENRAAWEWWEGAGGPFDLHVSLHGMGFAAGPWHLIESAWRDRAGLLMERCRTAADDLGYALHDVERQGEKGFFRIARGFCTRPDSRTMRNHFLGLGDPETAARFRPSSMETMRSFGGDPLTLVTEMPLFLTPGVGDRIGPPDPVLEEWRTRIAGWRERLAAGADPVHVSGESAVAGLKPMPIRDHMKLQWRLISAGIEQVRDERTC
jgi:hypothetical protein